MTFPSNIRQIGLLSIQTTIAAVTIALIAGSIHPVKAEAVTVPAITQPAGTQVLSPQFISNPSLTFVQENISFTKLSNLAGDTDSPGIKIPATTLPPIDTGFYFLHMYNAVTGEYIESMDIQNKKALTYNFKKMIHEGENYFQLILRKEQTVWPEDMINLPANLADFNSSSGVLGKSGIINYDRAPISLSVETDAPTFSSRGYFKIKVNQKLSGSDYILSLYDLTDGRLLQAEKNLPFVMDYNMFPNGGAHQYQAIIAKRSPDKPFAQESYEFSNIENVADVHRYEAASNIVSYARDPWTVVVGDAGMFDNFTHTQISITTFNGGGRYRTYLVENSTQKVIFHSDSTKSFPSNQGHGDNYTWATAYVAQEFGDGPEPQTYEDVKALGIIADSNGFSDDSGSIIAKEQVSGGMNPSEACAQSCHADPINAATGEFFQTSEDISTVGSGLIPKIERSFSTMNKDTLSALGYGWRTNYEMKIVTDPDTEKSTDTNILTSRFLQVVQENSSRSSFYRKTDGTFSKALQTMGEFSFDTATQTFTLKRNTGESFVFNADGNLIKISNEKGQVVTLAYANGKLSSVTDLVGNSLSFTYNTKNIIDTVTDQNNRIVKYTYNTSDNLTKIVDAKAVTYNYTYDTSRRVKTLSNALGGITTNVYDTDNRVTKQTDPLGRITKFAYSSSDVMKGGTTKITYPNNKIIEETYESGRLLKTVENFGKANAQTTLYTYDGTNQVMSTVNPDGTSLNTLHDARGNLTQVIDARRNTTSFTYDAKDNLLTATDPYGNVITNTYDSANNLISTTTPLGEKTAFTYNADKTVASVTDARGNAVDANPADFTNAFTYTSKGQGATTLDPLGNVKTNEYNAKGQVSKTIDSNNKASIIDYNALGLPSKVTDPLLNETALTYDPMGNVLTSKDALNNVTTYTYDLVGNLLTAKNALQEVTTYEYNTENQMTKIIGADNSFVTVTYDVFGRVTETIDQLQRSTKQEWNSVNQLVASIDADNNRTEYTYDMLGNLKTVKTPSGAVSTFTYDKMNRVTEMSDPMNLVTKIEYDANGRVTKTILPDSTSKTNSYDVVGNIVKSTNQNGKSKLYTYDALNRQVTYTNETGQLTSYGYDAVGNLTSQTRSDSSVISYVYDARNSLVTVDYPGTDEDMVYTYDALGRKITEKQGNKAIVNYTYDNLNRVLTRGSTGSSVAYEYDMAGNIAKLTYPSGRVVNYSHDTASQLTSLGTVGIDNVATAYNKRGLPTTVTLPNGVVETNTYDNESRLTSSELLKDATSLYKRSQTYNLVNDVTQRGVQVGATPIKLEDFVYDPLSRLTEQKNNTDGSSMTSYGYNNVSNLTTYDGAAQGYDDAGKVLSSGTKTLGYDSLNQRTSEVDSITSSKNIEYSWTASGRLSTMTSHKNNIDVNVGYEYNEAGLLETKKVDGVKTNDFVWDMNTDIARMLSDGDYEYIYNTDNTPVAQVAVASGIITYLHKALNGSVTASTDSSGALLGTVDYSPYGKPTGALLSAFGYAGEWVDKTTGNTFLRARWLDVSKGTFLSEDPLVQMTNNAFGYTDGNPITQIDPTGLFKIDIGGFMKTAYNDWDWDKISEVAGWVAVGALVGAMIVATGGVAAPALIAGIVTMTSVAAASAATVATTKTCNPNINKEFSGMDCTASVVSTGLAWAPLGGVLGSKAIKNYDNLARLPLAAKTGAYSPELNASITTARVFWTGANASGNVVSGGYGYFSSKIGASC